MKRASRLDGLRLVRLIPIAAIVSLLIACSGPGSDLPSPVVSPSPAGTRLPPATVAVTVPPAVTSTAAPTTVPTTAATVVPTFTVPAPSPAATAPIPTAPVATRAAGSSPVTSPPTPTAAIPPSTGPLVAAYRIAFVSNSAAGDDIWTVDPDGRRLTDLTKTQKAKGNDSDPQWSPDGSRIAFVSDRDGGGTDIWVMNADGMGARNVTHTAGDDFSPRWSPDGKRIAFTSFRDSDAEIYVMNADGTEQTNLTKSDGDDLQPAWSPDGARIAFVSERGKKPRALYALSLDAPKNPTSLAAPPCDVASPAWAPDGKNIAVVACAGADGQGNVDPLQHVVYIVGAGGGGLVAVSDPKVESGGPAYAPDGKSLAYWSYRNRDQADIVVVVFGANARRVIQAPPGVAREPAWSADGTTLAFIDGDFTIGNLIVSDSGGQSRNVTNHPANDRSPRWSPQKLS
ncbi:MAG: TolB family protein [Thermomicrobiales bacterium]